MRVSGHNFAFTAAPSLLLGVALASLACNRPKKDDSGQPGPAGSATSTSTADAAPTVQPATAPATGAASAPAPAANGSGAPASAAAPWTAGPGIPGCEAQGLAWVAVMNGGPGACGDPLADWCCTKDEVLSRFAAVATGLAQKFAEYESQGLILYQCSVTGEKTTFHFASTDASGVHYRSVYVSGAQASSLPPPVSCPKVTMQTLGIPVTATSSPGAAPASATTAAAIPPSVGPFVSTESTALVAQLTAETRAGTGYKQWTAATGVVNSAAHGGRPTKTYVNDLLTKSMASSSNVHPVGSAAVKELYDDARTKVVGYFVLAKATAGTGSATWFTFAYGTAAAAPTATVDTRSMGAAPCAACHEPSSSDFIKALTP